MIKKKLLSAMIVLMVLISGCQTNSSTVPSSTVQQNEILNQQPSETVGIPLKVHFIDVGQADASLLESEGHFMMIDAGNNDDASLLVKYLKAADVQKLDYFVGTHLHEDHIGSMDTIIENFDVGTVILPNQTHTTDTFEDVLTAISDKGLTITVPTPETIFYFQGIVMAVLGRLESLETKFYRTDETGTVAIETDGENIGIVGAPMQSETAIQVDDPSESSPIQNTKKEQQYYIGNINSKKFHKPSCNKLPDSFLQNLLFGEERLKECNITGLSQLLNNNAYVKRKYVEFYFFNNNKAQIQQLVSYNSPAMLSILTESTLPESLKIYILNTLFYFPQTVETVLKIIKDIYSIFLEMQQGFITENEINKLLRDDLVLEKFYAITKLDRQKSFVVSFSIMCPDVFSFLKSQPDFLLLGQDFRSKLDEQYKYCHVTPLLFARAIGNPIKHEIFQLLSHKPSMNISTLSTELNYSRSELGYNLKEMIKIGIVCVYDVVGRQYFYKLDIDFIRTVNGQLTAIL